MDTAPASLPTVNARSLLLPYAVGLAVSMLLIQVVIALTGGDVSLLAVALTGVVAAGIAAWLRRHYRELTQVRFGVAIAHAIAFATVTTSFNINMVVSTIAVGSGVEGSETAAQNLLATPWFGATLVMSAVWGLGLLVHLTGVVLHRGWED